MYQIKEVFDNNPLEVAHDTDKVHIIMKQNNVIFYVKKGEQLFHPTQHLFAAQLARECMITLGEGDVSMKIVDSYGKIYPNAF